MEQEINEFFRAYQLAIDNVWNGIQEYKKEIPNDFDEEETEKIILKWNNKKLLEDIDKTGLFLSIYNNSNIKIAQQVLSNFHFLPEFYYNRKFIYFGTDHGALHYAVYKKNKKVVLIDINKNKLLFPVAQGELAFLNVLTKICELQLFDKKIMKAETSIKYRNECIALAGGNDYAKLYNYTIISQDDCPSEPFYLS